MNSNKKLINFLKLVFLIVFTVLFAWFVAFCVDYNQYKKLRAPIFVVESHKEDNVITFNGIFYEVEQYLHTTDLGSTTTLVVEEKMYLFGKRIY